MTEKKKKKIDFYGTASPTGPSVLGTSTSAPLETLKYPRRQRAHTPEGQGTTLPIPREPLVKAGMHLEKQKFGRKPSPTQPELPFESIDTMEAGEESFSPEVVGVDLTIAQNKALFAIQKLLEETNYQGSLEQKKIESEPFKFYGYLPILKFKPADYLDAFGVRKRETSRGKVERNANERAEALKALRDLHDKRFLIFYERKYWISEKGKREERSDIIRTVRSLIMITEGYQNLEKMEAEDVKTGKSVDEKLTAIAIEPAPVMVDQIQKYFVLKPANYHQEIKLLVPHASKYVYTFIDYLMTEVAQRESRSRGRGNTNWTIRKGYKDLAYSLRMGPWIASRNWRQIQGSLKKCYDTAKELGYLKSYKTEPGVRKEVEVLVLNPDKFKRARQIEEERKQLEGLRPSQD